MNGKRLIFTSLVSIILVFMLLIGTTYSIFTTGGIEEDANVYKTGVLDITYTVSDENVKLQSNVPTSVEDAIYIKPYRIIVSNNGTTDYKFDLVLNNTTATNSIDSQYIMVQVGKNDPVKLSESENNVIKSGIVILSNSNVSIDVRVFLSQDIPNSEVGKNFTASLSIVGVAINEDAQEIDNSDLICDYLEKHSVIDLRTAVSDENRKYTDEDKSGLYYTYNSSSYGEDRAKIYYYSGKYDEVNNWVVFGKNDNDQDMCFRIIRTTKSGGTKLIYSGISKDNKCTLNTLSSDSLIYNNNRYNNQDNNPGYVLWQGASTDVNIDDFKMTVDTLKNNLSSYADDVRYDSVAKNSVREWYYTNIVNTGYKNYLEDINTCIELGDGKKYIYDNNYYFVDYLSYGYHPTYTCSGDSLITSDYGLITRDEALYAGLNLNNNSSSNWLVAKDSYWTLSPSFINKNNEAFISYVNKDGKLDSSKPTNELGIRPVISLKSSVTVVSGNGSIDNPYIIKISNKDE